MAASTLARRRVGLEGRGGGALLAGTVTLYLSLLVVLPLTAVVWRSGRDGWGAFWAAATQPQALAALRLSFAVALAVAAGNAAMGTLLAWVLVREEFPGKRVVNALVDLPFALPTIVAGVTLLALYGTDSPVGVDLGATRAGVVLALAFVTLPLVVRSVQPVLATLEPDLEEAARCLGAGPLTGFRRVVLPAVAPALLAGTVLAFARAVGELGSVVLVSGTIPHRTEVASAHVVSLVERDDAAGAAAVSVVLLATSVLVLAGLDLLRRRGARHGGADSTGGPPRWSPGPPRDRWPLRLVALGYLAAIVLAPVGALIWRAFGDGVAPLWRAVTAAEATHALWRSLLVAVIAVPLNTVFGVGCAVVLARHRSWGRRLLAAVVDLPLAVSPVVVGLGLVLVYGRAGWLGSWLAERGIQVIFSLPGMVLATVAVSLPYVARQVAPVLREVGTAPEEAAWTLGASPPRAFLQVTLPAIRWGVAYGAVLTTARALGEFGAVTILAGRTETLTLRVGDRFEAMDRTGAHAASLTLAALALLVLAAMTRLPSHRGTPPGFPGPLRRKEGR